MLLHRMSLVCLTAMIASAAVAQALPQAGPSSQSPADCKPAAVLEDYMKANNAGADATVLAYDHRESTWSGFAWKKAGATDGQRSLKPLDPQQGFHAESIVPLLRAPEGTSLKVFVTNTNPLLFHVTPIASTERDIKDLEALQSLLTRLGGLAAAAIKSGQTFEWSVREAKLTDSAVKAAMPGIESLDKRALTPEEVSALDRLTPTDSVIEDITVVISALDHWSADKAPLLSDLGEKSSKLKTATTALESVLGEVPPIIQHLESGRCPPRLLAKVAVDSNAPDGNSIELGFAQLEKSRRALLQPERKCEKTAAALAEWIGLLLSKELDALADRLKRKLRIAVLADALSQPRVLGDKCAGPPNGVTEALVAIGAHLAKGVIAPEHEDVFEIAWVSASRYGDMAAQQTQMEAAAAEILGKKSAALKARASIDFLIEREKKSAVGVDDNAKRCALRCGLIPVPREYGERVAVRWTKIRTEGLKIDMDAGRAELIVPSHPAPVEAKYDLAARRTMGFGVNVGLVYTDVRDPEWDAVTDPGDPNQKIVARTDETSRAGDLALLAVFEAWQWRDRSEALGVQVGTEVEGDPSALFAGVNFRFLKVVNLGVGQTWQKVSELARGLDEGKVVAGSDDIRTRDTWEGDVYYSLSFSLDELPFFKPKE